MTRRQFLKCAAAIAPLAAVGCKSGYKFLGYDVGAGALYDPNVRTVYVPLFNNRSFQTTPYRGFEIDVTQAVIREIGKTTSFRVTSDYERADTELLGNIVMIQKQILNRNQQNQVREAEVIVSVDVVWRDLRDGTILSNPKPRPAPGRPGPRLPDDQPVPFDPNLQPPPDLRELENPSPVRLVASGRLLPELGESNASAAQRVQNLLAVQIVSMMERRW
ncbi:MAG: LptE family protein [Planctomycetes bacterium]|nr:LptE family protein [Planctomycetota bacterium]